MASDRDRDKRGREGLLGGEMFKFSVFYISQDQYRATNIIKIIHSYVRAGIKTNEKSYFYRKICCMLFNQLYTAIGDRRYAICDMRWAIGDRRSNICHLTTVICLILLFFLPAAAICHPPADPDSLVIRGIYTEALSNPVAYHEPGTTLH